MEEPSKAGPHPDLGQPWFERQVWSRALLYGLYLLFGLGIIYLGTKVFATTGETGIDFRVIWLAGRMWLEGVNPYGEEFHQYYNFYFGYTPPDRWAYPPTWAPIVMPLGALPFSVAEYIWRIVNFAAVFGIVFLSFKLVKDRLDARTARYALLAGGIFLLFLKSTPIIVSMGQTAIVATFGLCLWFYGGETKKPFYSGLGLFLLLLKPQIAIIPLIVFFMAGRYRRGFIWGVALSVFAVLIPFFSIGFMETNLGFLHNVSLYNAPLMVANIPAELTGIVHLYDAVFSAKVQSPYLILLATIFSVSVGLSWRQKTGDVSLNSTPSPPLMLAFLISSTAVIMPLHSYDLVIFGPVALFVFLAKGWERVLMIAGLFLMFRAGNIAEISAFKSSESVNFPGSLIASISAAVVLIGASIPIISSWLKPDKLSVLRIRKD